MHYMIHYRANIQNLKKNLVDLQKKIYQNLNLKSQYDTLLFMALLVAVTPILLESFKRCMRRLVQTRK